MKSKMTLVPGGARHQRAYAEQLTAAGADLVILDHDCDGLVKRLNGEGDKLALSSDAGNPAQVDWTASRLRVPSDR